jgi:hypothetical protein
VRTVTGLTTGLKVSAKSTPGRCVNPRRTQRALYRSRVPSAENLCLKIHFPVTTLAWRGRGTKSQVGFCNRASYSSSMAECQAGSARPPRYVFGTGDREVAVKRTGTRKPCFPRVVMGCWLTTGGTTMVPVGNGAGAGAEAGAVVERGRRK